MIDRGSCGDCLYFCEQEYNPYGTCHRWPPVFTSSEYYAVWPRVGKDAWCGEFANGTHEAAVRMVAVKCELEKM